jgi:hypothetical protein
MPLSSIVPLGRLGTLRRSLRSSCFVTGTELFVEGGFAQV